MSWMTIMCEKPDGKPTVLRFDLKEIVAFADDLVVLKCGFSFKPAFGEIERVRLQLEELLMKKEDVIL